jgi:hypothetical protein
MDNQGVHISAYFMHSPSDPTGETISFEQKLGGDGNPVVRWDKRARLRQAFGVRRRKDICGCKGRLGAFWSAGAKHAIEKDSAQQSLQKINVRWRGSESVC